MSDRMSKSRRQSRPDGQAPAAGTEGPPQRRVFRPYLPLVLALSALLAVKSIVLQQLSGHLVLQPNANPDSGAYVELAQRVVAGDWALGPGMYFVSPLYVYFLAVLLAVSGSLTVAKFAQVLLGVVAVGCVWVAAREYFGTRAAWFAAALAGLTGLFTFYEITLMQASLDVFLTSAFLAALAVGLRRNNLYWLVAAGLACGVQSLNRPNVLLALAGVLFLLALQRRWRLSAAVVLGVAIGVSPVVVRNKVVVGEWSLFTSHGGLNLLIGNGPGASGVYRAIPGIRPNMLGQATDTRRVAEAEEGRSLTDAEVSRHFARQALSWMWNEPASWAQLMAKKLYYTFHAQDIALQISYPFFAYDTGSWLKFLPVGPWLLLPLGCFGLLACAPRDARAPLYRAWLGFAPAYAASVALFFVADRYRLPLLVPMAIGAGAALALIEQRVRAGQWRGVVRGVGAIGLLAVVMNWPLGWVDADGRLEERLYMAETLAKEGNNSEAVAWAARALPGYPYQREARLRLGRAFAGRQEWALAIENLQAAHSLDPADPVVALELARAQAGASNEEAARTILAGLSTAAEGDADTWLALGRLGMSLSVTETAQRFFLKGVALAPESGAAREQLGVSYLMSNELEPAQRELSEAVRLSPDNADAWASLAAAFLQLGRAADAVRCADRALALVPGHPLARQVRNAAGR